VFFMVRSASSTESSAPMVTGLPSANSAHVRCGWVASRGDALHHDVPVGEHALESVIVAADRHRSDLEIPEFASGVPSSPPRRLNHDRIDPVGRLLFNVFAMVAEFEADLIRLRTREGMKIAKARGRLRGRRPKLKTKPAKHLLEPHDSVPGHAAQGLVHFGACRSRRPARRTTRPDGGSP
jgi:hypothetical protein